MKTLHTLMSTPALWMWAAPRNARYSIIIDQNGQRTSHLYLVPRGQPPHPIGRSMRRAWTPYTTGHSRTFILNPLCGRLRGTSQWPSLGFENWIRSQCTTCANIATERNITPITLQEATAIDPWAHIPWDDRQYTPDPVTGY